MSVERVRALCAEVDWGAVGHAYGFATEIPFALEELAATREDAPLGMLVLGGFWGNVFHQGSRYDASVVTLPILVEIACDPACAVRTSVLDLVVALLLGSEETFIDTGCAPSTGRDEEKELLNGLQAAFDGCVDRFVELLSDGDARTRASAARCLAWVRAPAAEARSTLGKRFATEHDADVRATILYALSLLGEDTLASGALSDADAVVRVYAALAIVRLRGGAASPAAKAVVRAAASADRPSGVPFLRGELRGLASHLGEGTDVAADPSITTELGVTLRARAPLTPIEPKKSPKPAQTTPTAFQATAAFASDLSTVPRHGPSADERVRWAHLEGDKLHVAGDFAQIGEVTGTAAILSTDGQRVIRLPWPRLTGGWTSAVVDDGEGGFIFGGQWTQSGAHLGGGIGRLRHDGEVDERWPSRWSGVRCDALARDGRTLFAIVRGGPLGAVPSLFGIDMESLAIVWRPKCAGEVTAIALVDRTLFVGGRFDRIEGAARPGLAAFDVDSRELLAFTAPPLARLPRRFAVTSRNLYVGSHLQVPRPDGRTNALVAVDRATGAIAWESDLGPEADVSSLAVGGERLYVGGRFTFVGDARRKGACAFSLDDHRLLDWAPVDDEMRSDGIELVHCVDDDTILVGGSWTPRGGRPIKGIAWIDARGASKGLDVRVAGSVVGAAVQNGRIAVAGGFPMVAEARVDVAAEIDLRTGTAHAWDLPTTTATSAAEDAHGACSSTRDGVVAHRGPAGSWEVRTNERVAQIVLDESRVWLVGRFTRVSGQPRHYLACLSRATGAVLPARADFDRPPAAVASVGEHVFVAGSFRHVGREAITGLVRLDARDGSVVPLAFPTRGSVRVLATSGHRLALLGSFSRSAEDPIERILLLDVATSAEVEVPLALRALNGPGRITHATFRGEHLVVAGDFTVINGHPRSGLAEIALDGRVSEWAPRLTLRRSTPIVETLVANDARVVVGGSVAITHGGVIALDLLIFEQRSSVS